MPHSDPTFDRVVCAFIRKHEAQHFLDIGAGSGKYAMLIRSCFPKATIIGVESEAAYVREFKLAKLYTKIVHERIEHFVETQPDFVTDIAIIGDCIEHLSKSAGIDLLHYLMYRTRYIIIVFPTAYIQYTWRNHRSEAHRSVWDKSDFVQFEHTFRKKGFMNMVIVTGYRYGAKTTYAPGLSMTKSPSRATEQRRRPKRK